MQSSVNWALLGLVIERPSYAYELAQRFERTYDGVLSLSSSSHVYTALGTLEGRGLVEEIAGSRAGRQPKPRYRATPTGVREYREWLLGQVGEERRRQRLLMLQLTALTRDLQMAPEVIADYERACLAQAIGGSIPVAERTAGGDRTALGDGTAAGGEAAGEESGLSSRLLAEEERLAAGARLAWVQYAREQLKPANTHQAPRR